MIRSLKEPPEQFTSNDLGMKFGVRKGIMNALFHVEEKSYRMETGTP